MQLILHHLKYAILERKTKYQYIAQPILSVEQIVRMMIPRDKRLIGDAAYPAAIYLLS